MKVRDLGTKLDEALNFNYYGGWITPEKKVHYVKNKQSHYDVASEHFDATAGKLYQTAYTSGWVRFIMEDYGGAEHGISVEGTYEALKNTFFVWFPTARMGTNLYLDLIKTIDMEDGRMAVQFYKLDMPKYASIVKDYFRKNQVTDLEKYRRRFTFASESIVNEELDDYYYGGWIRPDNEVLYTSGMDDKEHYDMIAAEGLNWQEAFRSGWVRFTWNGEILTLEGTKSSIKSTSKVWKKDALKNATDVYVDLINWDGNGSAGHMHIDATIEKPKIRKLTEAKIEAGTYGGWITDKKQILYGDQPEDHEKIIKKHGMDEYEEAWNKGWVRFVHGYDDEISLQGPKQNILNTMPMWYPLARKENRKIYIGIPYTDFGSFDARDIEDIKRFLTSESKSIPNNASKEINEAKVMDVESYYGAWITPDKEIIYVNTPMGHQKVLAHYIDTPDYYSAMRLGWIRITFGSAVQGYENEIAIQGTMDALRNTFFVWSPTASKAKKLHVNVRTPNGNGNLLNKSLEMPKDLGLFKNWLKGKATIHESQIKEAKLEDVGDYGAWIDSENGKIYYVRDVAGHSSKLKELGFKSYNQAISQGFIRVNLEVTSLGLEGLAESIEKTIPLWWPILRYKRRLNLVAYGDKSRSIFFERPYTVDQVKSFLNKCQQNDKLNEAKIIKADTYQHNLSIYVNPTAQQIKVLAKKHDGTVRGLMDEGTGDYFIWDADLAVHNEIARYLRLEYLEKEYDPKPWLGFYITMINTSIDAYPYKEELQPGLYFVGYKQDYPFSEQLRKTLDRLKR